MVFPIKPRDLGFWLGNSVACLGLGVTLYLWGFGVGVLGTDVFSFWVRLSYWCFGLLLLSSGIFVQ